MKTNLKSETERRREGSVQYSAPKAFGGVRAAGTPGCDAPLRAPLPQPSTINHQPSTTYALRNRDGFWELTFDGRTAVLKQNQALFYVAWLLAHAPAQPLAAPVLAARVYEAFGTHEDFREDGVSGAWQPAALEGAKVLRVRQQALEAIVDSEDELEPVKAEALRELEEV